MKISGTAEQVARQLVRLKYQFFLADLVDRGAHTMFIPGDTFEAEVAKLRLCYWCYYYRKLSLGLLFYLGEDFWDCTAIDGFKLFGEFTAYHEVEFS